MGNIRIPNPEERIHVLDNDMNVCSVIRDIAYSGVQEEAFYICDIEELVQTHNIWTQAMPKVKPFYAVKCNDNLMVIKVLAALGANFDCASKNEINKVLSLGVDPTRIIFANPTKPNSHIRYAASVGVETMTFDNESELHKLQKFYPTAKLVIRIRCDDPDAKYPLGEKFGCDYIKEAPKLLRTAKNLGLNVIGVSFHIGSGSSNPQIFHLAIKYARRVFDYATSIGYKFNLLDIGGGYPNSRSPLISAIANVVNKALDDYFPDPNVHVIAEPGNFYVASAFSLACQINSVRCAEIEDQLGKVIPHNMYYINDGVYGSFIVVLFNQLHSVPVPLKEHANCKLISSSIWGPTCDSADQVIKNIFLPELQVGEWLVFKDMGAYTLSLANSFNGFSAPKVHAVATESIRLQLKDKFPLSEDHFVFGNTPANLRLGLDTED